MRKLPLPIVLAVLALLGAALPAQAGLLAQPTQAVPRVAPEDEADEAGDPADEEDGELEEACEPDEDELCEEEDEEPRGRREAEEEGCLLKDASVAVSVYPGKRRLRLSVRYRTWKPVSVNVEAALRGVKGAVYLGTSHAHFRRSGVYRETFELAEKQTKKALAAREVSADLQVVNAPASCGLHLSEAVRRPKH